METEKIKLLQERMQEAVDAKEFSGITLLYQEKDYQPVFLSAGLADIEQNVPMTKDTIFRLYSQTKPITAAAAMILLEDGVIDLYDPVGKFFPGFLHSMVQTQQGPVPALHVMTIRDLLNMTSGLVYPDGRTQAETDTGKVYDDLIARLGTADMMSTSEFAERMSHCLLQFDPSTNWQYGTSADILGAVIEKAADMPFGEFLKERIFTPLGMEDTGFTVPDEKRSRLAAAYICHTPDELPEGEKKAASGSCGKGQEVREDPSKSGQWLERYAGCNLGIRSEGGENPFESGGAGLFSTLPDYLRFARMLRDGGRSPEGEQILRPGTISFFTSHQLDDIQQKSFHAWVGLEGHSYGNLLRVMQDSRKAGIIGTNGEYGWDGWLGTYFANVPSEDATLLLGIQRYGYGTGTYTRKLRNIVFS